ncbi:unnamed protein product [Calicophoron daubneyi]|uniref:EF-hand domain-containing protein n=1 Tax=Calicophoron daubneyi TaxID=300641 RepID=A0AAV2TSN3_CALDB
MAYLRAFEAGFESLDRNGDKKVSKEELITFMTAYGFLESDAEGFLAAYDTDKDGKISKAEWMNAALGMKKQKVSEAEIRKQFRSADKDNSGKISVNELQSFLKQHKNLLSDKQVQDLVKKYDKNKDKQLDYNEFLTLVRDKL